MKGYFLYAGFDEKKALAYVGTTIQNPADRFRRHRNNGNNLDFKLLLSCDNSKDMLDKEFELIKLLKPYLNKITNRKQNLNKKLSEEEIKSRKDSSEWCQKCFKRRVNKGYTFCLRCG